MATAVCKVLGVPARPGTASRELERAMARGLRGLIVLDNCEHVLGAAADVVDTILRNSSSVAVLATSRQALDVDGERVWPVQPLPVGVAGSGGAVDLFLSRAADAGAVLDPEAHAVVGVICQRLDGLPLAVELAAARVRALGADGLLASLAERLDGLGGTRRAPPRHQTLRAAVEWSLDRLNPRRAAFEHSLADDNIERAGRIAEVHPGENRIVLVGGHDDGAFDDPVWTACLGQQRKGHGELAHLLRVTRDVDIDGVAPHGHLLHCVNWFPAAFLPAHRALHRQPPCRHWHAIAKRPGSRRDPPKRASDLGFLAARTGFEPVPPP
ncbi:MAG: hypothetical protein ACR2HP_11115 [Ilumatobacteraceae bacterium]